MTTTTVPDLEQLHGDVEVALDRWTVGQLEFDPECEIEPLGWTCEQHATWVAICVQCGHNRFCCRACRTGYADLLQKMSTKIPQCINCHAFAPRVEDLFDFRPIRGTE